MLTCATNMAFVQGAAKDIKYDFHLAESDAEKKLDHILHFSESAVNTRNLCDFISKWPHINPDIHSQYTDLFTEDYIYSWSNKEKERAGEDNFGKYLRNDRYCLKFGAGFFSTLHCTQYYARTYIYRTLEKGKDHAIIQYKWPESNIEAKDKSEISALATFKLVRHNNIWLLDASRCEGQAAPFNEAQPPAFNINY